MALGPKSTRKICGYWLWLCIYTTRHFSISTRGNALHREREGERERESAKKRVWIIAPLTVQRRRESVRALDKYSTRLLYSEYVRDPFCMKLRGGLFKRRSGRLWIVRVPSVEFPMKFMGVGAIMLIDLARNYLSLHVFWMKCVYYYINVIKCTSVRSMSICTNAVISVGVSLVALNGTKNC